MAQDGTQTAIPATPSTPSTPSTAPLSIPDFAAKIRQRDSRLTPDIVDDSTLVRKVLERKPELMKYVETSEPRKGPLKERKDRTPTADQRMQKFFENHPIMREALSGALGGAGASETSPTFWGQFSDFAKGIWHTATDEPKSKDETAAKYSGLPLAVYRMAKGLVQQTGGYSQEAFDAVDWNKFWETAKTKGGGANPLRGESLPQILSESLKKDESGRNIGGEKLAHATAGLATMIFTVLKGGKETPEALQRVGEGAVNTAKGAVEASKAVAGGPTRAVQMMSGTGTHLAEKVATGEMEKGAAAIEKHAGAVEKITDQNAAANADYNTKVERVNQDFDQKVEAAKQKYADNVAEREKKVAELQGQHAEKVAAARAEWVRKAYEAKQAGAQASKLAARREALEHGQKAYTKLVDDNVKATHDNYAGVKPRGPDGKVIPGSAYPPNSLNGRWDSFWDRMGGKDTPLPNKPRYEAIEKARAELAGTPPDLAIFNQIVKEITEKSEGTGSQVVDSPALGLEGKRPETGTERILKDTTRLDDYRTQHSALGVKAAEAEGRVKKLLYDVYEASSKPLEDLAVSRGAAKEYAGLKREWHQYQMDWHDSSAYGSQLAKLYRAINDKLTSVSPAIEKKVTGGYSNQIMETFARYDKYGASPTLMSKLRDMNAVTKALPKSVKVPNVPERLSPPEPPKPPAEVPSLEPKLGEIESDRAKRLERTEKPIPKPLPIPPAPPTVTGMIEELKKAKLQKAKEFGEGHARARTYDMVAALEIFTNPISSHSLAYPLAYLGARVGWAVLANSEWMRTWLSRVTPADIKMLDEVYKRIPEDKAAAQQAITNGLIDRAKKGEKLPPLSTFQSLLNKAQLGAILRVVAPPVQGQQQQTRPAAQVQ